MRRVFCLATVLILGLTGCVAYRTAMESYVAEGITIQVLNYDYPRTPIPETIIILESENGDTAIQRMTDRNGKVYFKRITPGQWKIRATQISCEGKNAQTMYIWMQGSNVHIGYFPCV